MDRPFRRAFATDEVLRMMKEERGGHFDPTVLDAFFDRLPEIKTIREEHVVH
jgi:putative two-component system response regulator